jgi:signal transduction histidine kinase
VALGGESLSFEYESETFQRHFRVTAFSPLYGQFATIFEDVTERKHAEGELQRISKDENKRREELEKLREVSTSMRQAEGSASLLKVVTKEVQELCQADVTASILFKTPQSPIMVLAPEVSFKLSREQSEAITNALLNAKTGLLSVKIPGFESILILQLQSSDTVYGATLVASRVPDAFTTDAQNMLNPIADMAGTALQRIDILETLEERVQQRTHDLVVLYNLITIISENWHLQDILELSLVLTLETVKANRGIIYLVDGKEPPDLKPVIQRGFGNGFDIEVDGLPDDELALRVLETQRPLALENIAEYPAYAKFDSIKCYAGIPIMVRGDMRGVFSLFASEKDSFGSDEMALLTSIADHLGIGVENSILWEQSRESAAIEERNRLARNLHDSVSQLLYSLTLIAGSTKKMLERKHDPEAVKHSVERLGDTAHQALKEMRLLLYELRPAVLDSEGLVSALKHRIGTVEERLGVKVDIQAKGLPDLPSDMEDALYHIALEALNNIVKHAESKTASIKITSDQGNIVMEISDQGRGFDPNGPRKGQGLRNMRERGQMLGGEVEVTSKPGKGTQVRVTLKTASVSIIES